MSIKDEYEGVLGYSFNAVLPPIPTLNAANGEVAK